jgi:spore maturation protein CgeB
MKIFFIGTIPIDGAGVSPDTMEAHIVEALGERSIECMYFPFLTQPWGSRLNRLFEHMRTDLRLLSTTPAEHMMIKAAEAFQPDLILVLLGNYTAPETIRKVRAATGAPVVCWCQDHLGSMGRQYIIGSKFDYLFTKDQSMVDLFRRYTSLREVHYLPEACNPKVHCPVTPTDEEHARFSCDITTAANVYYFRAEILESLSEFNLRVWGLIPGFNQGAVRRFCTGKPIFTRDKAACFNSAKIVINSLHPMESGGLNARAFEVAGCGGFQLITHSDAVARHFVPGREIETFRDLGELHDKVVYYLAHDDERQAIAEAGRKRAHNEHTYARRLEKMLNIVTQRSPERRNQTAT